MKNQSLRIAGLFLLLLGHTVPGSAQSPRSPAAVFKPWDGEWDGVFKIFNTNGELVDSLEVHQKYFWDGEVQKGIITDKYADGRIEISHAENFVRNDTLYCVVKKAGGERTVHRGGNVGGRLTWSRQNPETGMLEAFKEYVEIRNGTAVYFIDGVGIYGYGEERNVLLFEGRYRKRPK